VNDGYRSAVFVSRGNIGNGANDNSFRLDLGEVVQLELGGIQLSGGANGQG
jgi:hypothetical protein